MAPVKTEDFPYTSKYVKELFKLDEHTLMAYVEALSVVPKVDELTGSLVFNHRDIELLRKAIDMTHRGEELSVVVEQLGLKKPKAKAGTKAKTAGRRTAKSATSSAMVAKNEEAVALQSMADERTSLAMVVESVSQAKESILKDLSRLLDDKLAGLDEVVVELIRCKSENDALKQKLQAAIQEKQDIQKELDSFKPVQFGFYRKVGK